jgi:hypothetical protein
LSWLNLVFRVRGFCLVTRIRVILTAMFSPFIVLFDPPMSEIPFIDCAVWLLPSWTLAQPTARSLWPHAPRIGERTQCRRRGHIAHPGRPLFQALESTSCEINAITNCQHCPWDNPWLAPGMVRFPKPVAQMSRSNPQNKACKLTHYRESIGTNHEQDLGKRVFSQKPARDCRP